MKNLVLGPIVGLMRMPPKLGSQSNCWTKKKPPTQPKLRRGKKGKVDQAGTKASASMLHLKLTLDPK